MKKNIKYILIILFLLITNISEASSLVRVEQLTKEEIEYLKKAKEKIIQAQEDYSKTSIEIANKYNMKIEEWMEWKQWFVIEEPYILLYRSDNY